MQCERDYRTVVLHNIIHSNNTRTIRMKICEYGNFNYSVFYDYEKGSTDHVAWP